MRAIMPMTCLNRRSISPTSCETLVQARPHYTRLRACLHEMNANKRQLTLAESQNISRRAENDTGLHR